MQDAIHLESKNWTYAQHKVINTKPTLQDFKICVGECLAWEVGND
ncbi:hypothetical protein [Helicobacter aurati]|nr:hypothetical protein [Helicobacter aurati]